MQGFFSEQLHFRRTYFFTVSTSYPENIRLDEDVLKTSFVFVLTKTNMFALALSLQNTSSRRLGQDQYICLGHTSSRRLQDVFKMFSRRLQDVLPRCLQDVFKMSCKNIFKTSSRRLGRRKIVTLKTC